MKNLTDYQKAHKEINSFGRVSNEAYEVTETKIQEILLGYGFHFEKSKQIGLTGYETWKENLTGKQLRVSLTESSTGTTTYFQAVSI